MAEQIAVDVRSLYGAKTQRGIVELRIGDNTVQISPLKAREIADTLIECAEGAETDQFIVDFLTKTIGIDLERACILLTEFRKHRLIMKAQQTVHEQGEST